MKKSIFDKTLTGLVLAVFASVVLAIGVAMAGDTPVYSPTSDYVAPTFQALRVLEDTPIGGEIQNPGDGSTPCEGFCVQVAGPAYGLPLVINDQVEINYGLEVAKSVSVAEDLDVNGKIANSTLKSSACTSESEICRTLPVIIDSDLQIGTKEYGKGIMLSEAVGRLVMGSNDNRPMITINNDPFDEYQFVNKNYSGVGRWGIYMNEDPTANPSYLAFGVPHSDDEPGAGFRFVEHHKMGGSNVLMQLDNNGVLDMKSTVIKNTDITDGGSVTIEDNLKIVGGNESKGIVLDPVKRPMITSYYSQFTSGKYEGVGAYGLFKEDWRMTFGIPNIANTTYFDFKKFSSDSTGTTLMRLSSTGILDLNGGGVIKNSGTANSGALKIADNLNVTGTSTFTGMITGNVTGTLTGTSSGTHTGKQNGGITANNFMFVNGYDDQGSSTHQDYIAANSTGLFAANCPNNYTAISCQFKPSDKNGHGTILWRIIGLYFGGTTTSNGITYANTCYCSVYNGQNTQQGGTCGAVCLKNN